MYRLEKNQIDINSKKKLLRWDSGRIHVNGTAF